jgi:hypothetical protein
MKKLPVEIVSSTLAVTTLFYPWHLPVWAIFVGWAGTFAAGGPKPEVLRKIWPCMALGNVTACLIVLLFNLASQHLAGASFTMAQVVILFCLNGGMMALGRFEPLSFIPGMFFGFASYFATYFGGFGPAPKDPLIALVSVMAMNALGPVYAILTARFGEHRHAPAEASGRAHHAEA